MSDKARRHAAILRLIGSRSFRGQDALREALAEAGFECTQATLSRDLAAIGVLKGPEGYVAPNGVASPAVRPHGEPALAAALRRELLSVEQGGTMVVLRTPPGHGNALAVELDRTRPNGMLGSIAGDDTVFLAAASPTAATRLARSLRRLAGIAAS
ncbi:MAG: arginine repressor [Phycisphaerales bacterium]